MYQNAINTVEEQNPDSFGEGGNNAYKKEIPFSDIVILVD